MVETGKGARIAFVMHGVCLVRYMSIALNSNFSNIVFITLLLTIFQKSKTMIAISAIG
jgi:hypothetical protein